MKKNPIKTLKNWLAAILTGLVVVTLFCLIFVVTEISSPTPSFFLELGMVLGLTVMMKIWWFDFAEDKRLNAQDIQDAKNTYYKMLDATITDSNDLDVFVDMLNKENKQIYITNKIGCRTPKNMALEPTKLLCFIHPKYKGKTKEEIGQMRYDRLLYKYSRKADKIRPIKSEEIMALSDSKLLYDTKNHTKERKLSYQASTTIISFVLVTGLSIIGIKEIMLDWTNLIRFASYLCAMVWTIATTLLNGYKITGTSTLDYINRLKFVVDKYATYKEKKEVNNGIRICGNSE